MDGSTELDVGGNRGSGRASRRTQSPTNQDGVGSWFHEVGQAPVDITNATVYAAGEAARTKGAKPVGWMIFGIGCCTFGMMALKFASGFITFADTKPLHRNAAWETQLGRTVGRGSAVFVSSFSQGVSAAMKAEDAYYTESEESKPSRVSGVSYRRPEGMK